LETALGLSGERCSLIVREYYPIVEEYFASTTASVCTVSGTTATLVAPGTCTIQATQTGSVDYAAATPVSQSFTVAHEAYRLQVQFQLCMGISAHRWTHAACSPSFAFTE
jgi:hypothetical protein